MLKKIKVRLLLLGFFAVMVQIAVVPYLSIYMCEPDLCCAVTILLLMRYPQIHAVGAAFFIGMIKDIFSTHLFGLEIIALVVPACFFPYVIKKADTDNYFVKALLVLLFSLASCTVYLLTVAFAHQSSAPGSVLVWQVWGTALYTVVSAYYLDLLIAWCIPRKTMQYELF